MDLQLAVFLWGTVGQLLLYRPRPLKEAEPEVLHGHGLNITGGQAVGGRDARVHIKLKQLLFRDKNKTHQN